MSIVRIIFSSRLIEAEKISELSIIARVPIASFVASIKVSVRSKCTNA